MTEEQLNENLIKLELQNICQDCIYLDKIAPIIRKMISEEYKTGLEQSRFGKNMLERENQELKKQLEDLFNENSNLRKKLEKSMTFQDYEYTLNKKIQLENQQKEFIEWLEANLEALEMCDREFILTNNKKEIKAYKEALSKYKKIIGVERCLKQKQQRI